jgi:xanthine dehydrogenase/oxidase
LSFVQHEAEKAAENAVYSRTAMPINDMLRWFASTQIRNVACLGGNLVTASPISDMNPMLASLGASVILSKMGVDSISRRSVPVSEFFLRYRTVNIAPSEIVERVEVPVLGQVFDYAKPFKQARRREDDISIVTSGMHIRLAPKDGSFVIEHVALAFGGMAPTTVMAVETANVMIGSEFSRETFAKAQECLLTELNLPEGVPGGQAAYRMALAASFLQKLFFWAVTELKADVEAITTDPSAFASISLPLPDVPLLAEEEKSGLDNFLSAKKPSLSGVQTYPKPKVAAGLEAKLLPKADITVKDSASAVGKSSVHQSGALHCTGEALYCDDIPEPPGTLHGSLILSTTCGSTFQALDIDRALAIPGVVGVFTAEDIALLGGNNVWGPIQKDENIFHPIGEKIRTVGQVLGIVVGETLESAEMGARSVDVTYGPCDEKIIMTVEEAIAANSFFESTRHSLKRGEASVIDSLKSLEDSEGERKVGDIVKVSGSFSSGAQEHFYLETNSTLAVPSESDTNLTIYSSTQAATKTQTYCASSTGTPANKVVCRVKRLGGGFGGKETRRYVVSCCRRATTCLHFLTQTCFTVYLCPVQPQSLLNGLAALLK